MQITEFESITLDKDLQERYTRDAVTMFFSYPAVTRVTQFTWHPHGCTANPEAGMIDEDGGYKPNGEMWRRLWNEVWTTHDTLTTDESGMASLRGFMGDYEIRVFYDGQSKNYEIQLHKDGSAITCVF